MGGGVSGLKKKKPKAAEQKISRVHDLQSILSHTPGLDPQLRTFVESLYTRLLEADSASADNILSTYESCVRAGAPGGGDVVVPSFDRQVTIMRTQTTSPDEQEEIQTHSTMDLWHSPGMKAVRFVNYVAASIEHEVPVLSSSDGSFHSHSKKHSFQAHHSFLESTSHCTMSMESDDFDVVQEEAGDGSSSSRPRPSKSLQSRNPWGSMAFNDSVVFICPDKSEFDEFSLGDMFDRPLMASQKSPWPPIAERGVSLLLVSTYARCVIPSGTATRSVINGTVTSLTRSDECPAYAYLCDVTVRWRGKDFPATGHPNAFISHSWGAPFDETVSSAFAWADLNSIDPATVYLWLDAFCLNQHTEIPGKGISQEELDESFNSCIQCSKRVLFAANPWNDPASLHRLWCIIEVAYAIAFQCDFDVILSAAQQEAFTSAIEDDFASMSKMLASIDPDKATAFTPKDKAMLRDWILKGRSMESGMVIPPMTFSDIKKTVTKEMREWIASTARRHLTRLGSDDESSGKTMQSLGHIYFDQGKFADALGLYERVLAYKESVSGPSDPEVASILDCIAQVKFKQGKLDEALDMYQRTVEIDEARGVKGNRNPALTLNNMALVLGEQGKLQESLQLHQKALQLKKSMFGSRHPDVAASLQNIAEVMSVMGKYDNAIKLHTSALAIREAVFGPAHQDVAISLNNMGCVILAKGDYVRALELFKRALEINESTVGVHHLATGTTVNNMGRVRVIEKDYVAASKLFRRGLRIYEYHLGADHPATAVIIMNIGEVLQKQNDLPNAIKLFRRALKIREDRDATSQETANALNSVANVLFTLGDYAGALETFERTIVLKENNLGPDHPSTALALQNTAVVLKTLKRYEEARATYERAVAIYETSLGSDHNSTLLARKNLRKVVALSEDS